MTYNSNTGSTLWQLWINSAATTSGLINANTWTRWVTSTGTSTTTLWAMWNNGLQNPVIHAGRVEHVESSEAKAQRLAREAAFAEERKRLAAEREAALARSKKLLMECLTAQQQETLERHGYFDVKVGPKTYRISKGWAHNVREVLPDGSLSKTFCAHPRENVPDFDNMLAQKLILETDEPTFLRMANRGN